MPIDEQLRDQKRKVDYNSFDISGKELINMIKDKLIDVAPEYQRLFRWNAEKQSKFVESLFLGIPIPSLFMASNADGRWEVIDGVQRLCTLVNFAGDGATRKKIGLKNEKPLKLKKLEVLTEFNNKMYKDLPANIQLQFMLVPMKVITLSDKSDKAVRFDLFERINTGGEHLTDQEIRACIYKGEFNELLRSLALNKDFNKLLIVSDSELNDGTREEMVLRFFAYFENYREFSHSVKGFLNDYMDKYQSLQNFPEDNVKIFNIVCKELLNALPNGISKDNRNTQKNLFEAITVGAALAYTNKKKINTSNINEWMFSEELAKFTSGGTNAKPKVVGRIEYCKNMFERENV